MTRRARIFIISAGSFLLLLIAATLILPPIIRSMLEKKITEATGRPATVSRFAINPLTLSATLDGFRLGERTGSATFVSFSSARIAISPASVLRQAAILSSVRVRAPYVRLVRNGPNSYNFSDLLEKKEPDKKKESTPHFSLNNIELRGGSVDFLDSALSTPVSHSLRGISLAVPFVSTIPYLADHYVSPHFSAVLNGTAISAEGKLKPLSRSVEALFNFSLDRVDLPYYLAYLPKEVPLAIDSGRLSSRLAISYQVSSAALPELTVSGTSHIDHLSLRERSGPPLLKMEQFSVSVNSASIFARSYDLASVVLKGPELFLDRNEKGLLNLQRLSGPSQSSAAGLEKSPDANQESGQQAAKTRLSIANLEIAGGTLHFRDRMATGNFQSDISPLDFALKGLSTELQKTASWSGSLKTARSESLRGEGELTLDPLAVNGRLAVDGIRLESYYPYLAGSLSSPVSALLGASATVGYSQQGGLTVADAGLTARNLAVRFSSTDGIVLKEIILSGGSFSAVTRQAAIERIEVRGGTVALTREADGSLSAAQLVRRTPDTSLKETSPSPPATPFGYRIGSLAVSGIGATFRDLTRSGPPLLAFSGLKANLRGISGPALPPFPFSVSGGFGSTGKFAAGGTLGPTPFRLKGNVELRGIPLRDLDGYLPENLNLFIADGSVDTAMALDIRQGENGMTGTFAGSAGVRSFYCLDTVDDEDLLKWESLQLDQVSGALAPFALTIRQVALNSLYARLIIHKDGTLNLQQLTTKPPPAEPSSSSPEEPPKQAASLPVPQQPRSQVRIDSITLQDGTIAFDDRHLPRNFSTTFYSLGGRVTGISSSEAKQADVDLRGNLENHSPLRITGTFNPLWADPFVDLKISFSDIDLSPFTPYSGTYLGYAVDKGKLFLDLTYRVEKKALKSENHIFFDQFTFGEPVASEKATSLPVRLAVALLKDRKGEIHLDLPVAGRTDDPKFSIWSVILQMLKNLLVKAATSPFTLLSSLFSGTDDFSAITFPPGSSRLPAAEQEKLAKLASAISERPALKLEITGYVDRDRDVEGFRQETLLRKMKTEKFLALSRSRLNQPGQTTDSIELLPDEQSLYLKAVYAKEKFPKPRNVIGMVKELPDDETRKLILVNTPAGNEEMAGLAREREAAVRDYLLVQGKLPAERIFLKKDDIFRPSSKEGISNARVEFGADAR